MTSGYIVRRKSNLLDFKCHRKATALMLANFPTPTNCTDLQSFFGLVNQLSSSTDTVAQLLLPLHPLLSTKHEFVWLAEHDQAFARVRWITT